MRRHGDSCDSCCSELHLKLVEHDVQPPPVVDAGSRQQLLHMALDRSRISPFPQLHRVGFHQHRQVQRGEETEGAEEREKLRAHAIGQLGLIERGAAEEHLAEQSTGGGMDPEGGWDVVNRSPEL